MRGSHDITEQTTIHRVVSNNSIKTFAAQKLDTITGGSNDSGTR